MPNEWVPLSHRLITEWPVDTPIAYHSGHYYSFDQFERTVQSWVVKLQTQPFRHYALHTEDAYPFAVLLFALLHAGKQIWIPGDNRPGTASLLPNDCQLLGDWPLGQHFDEGLPEADGLNQALLPLDPFEPRLIIFTSGSTGQAKPIAKCLNQFQLEIKTLEKNWGGQLSDAAVLGTVSHQHIYGLLFRVLWPLSAGRCFHSQAYLSPESLIKAWQQGGACWVASPAHLKRLDQNSPWQGIAGLKAIFSSGGALPESSAQRIWIESGQSAIEIYGSSETGGIAWRQQDEAWTLFEDMSLSCIEGNWFLHSPYVGDCKLDDQISLLGDGRFILHGRLDRIVKIEEKRLSLAALEQRLTAEPGIDEAHALAITFVDHEASCRGEFIRPGRLKPPLPLRELDRVPVVAQKRDIVAAVLVLNRQGVERLEALGRGSLIRQLRNALEQWFEPVVLPRKWLFLNAMPLNPQDKIDRALLKSLLDFDGQKLPQVLALEIKPEAVSLHLKVPEDLVYFPDHFADDPVLPGVVQLAWVAHFGRIFWGLDKKFSQLEAVKFIQVIRPGAELNLTLNWKATSGKLCFDFSFDSVAYSSGRMVYL